MCLTHLLEFPHSYTGASILRTLKSSIGREPIFNHCRKRKPGARPQPKWLSTSSPWYWKRMTADFKPNRLLPYKTRRRISRKTIQSHLTRVVNRTTDKIRTNARQTIRKLKTSLDNPSAKSAVEEVIRTADQERRQRNQARLYSYIIFCTLYIWLIFYRIVLLK